MLTVILLLAAVTHRGASQNCPFSNDCQCDDEGTIDCLYTTTFPTFAPYNVTWSFLSLTIPGNFTDMPPSALYPLAVNSSITTDYYFTMIGPAQPSPLTLYPESFRTTSMLFDQIWIQSYTFLVIPPGLFDNLTVVNILAFRNCKISNITDYAFVGLTVSLLSLSENGINFVFPHAFTGIKKIDQLNLSVNQLSAAVPEALKTVAASSVYLSQNEITQVLDYAFSATITTLDLHANPISFISDNAFANLTALTYLNLASCYLADIPVTALSFLRNLTTLYLDTNNVKFIAANSFYDLHYLTRLGLDINPITGIEAGAFNGLSSMIDFSLNSLNQLTEFDLLALYGMSNLRRYSMSFCPQSISINCSDWSKLPANLHTIDLSKSMNITTIDSQMKFWFLNNTKNTMDISNNVNFTCDNTIQWMSPFVCCSPYQIKTNGTLCSGGTKQTLTSYLQSFQPTCN